LKNIEKRVAWFVAELCKAQKGVQKDNRNQSWTELVRGCLAPGAANIRNNINGRASRPPCSSCNKFCEKKHGPIFFLLQQALRKRTEAGHRSAPCCCIQKNNKGVLAAPPLPLAAASHAIKKNIRGGPTHRYFKVVGSD